VIILVYASGLSLADALSRLAATFSISGCAVDFPANLNPAAPLLRRIVLRRSLSIPDVEFSRGWLLELLCELQFLSLIV
jgi:hypothetical protein